jgi:hypothetical protein
MWPFTKKKTILPSYNIVKIKPLVENDWLDENILQRVQKKHPDWNRGKVMDLIKEYKDFLYLCARDKEEHVPSAEVDEIWHEHILFTKDYENWGVFLGKKIHHNPEKIGETKSFNVGFQKTQQKLKTVSVSKPKAKKSASPSRIHNSSPSYTPDVVSDNLVTDLLLYDPLINHNHSHNHDCSPSYDSGSYDNSSHDSGSSSSASSCSSSSSSCSSSSCSSSSCGGGGGD